MSSVEQALASLGATLAAKKPEPEPEPKQPAKVVQLQIKFHPDAPPAPNDLLRSAFFPAIQSKDRQFINNEVIATLDGVTIRLLGKQLNQDDLDTFLVRPNDRTGATDNAARPLIRTRLAENVGTAKRQQCQQSLVG